VPQSGTALGQANGRTELRGIRLKIHEQVIEVPPFKDPVRLPLRPSIGGECDQDAGGHNHQFGNSVAPIKVKLPEEHYRRLICVDSHTKCNNTAFLRRRG
jgi:hypothetical protein